MILPRVDMGRSARLRNVVIDAEVKIPEGLVVGEDPELDAKRFRRTERGICLITQPMIDRLLDQPSLHAVPARDIPPLAPAIQPRSRSKIFLNRRSSLRPDPVRVPLPPLPSRRLPQPMKPRMTLP